MADAKADAKAEGDKRVKKKRPAKGDSSKDGGKKIPPTSPEAAAPKPGPVAEAGPMRYEGCGPCRRAVPDVPLSDAGRSSRDLLFLLFFVLWAIGDLVIAIIGFKTGSPQALIYGLDFDGNVCGRKNAVRCLRRLALRAPRLRACERRRRDARCARRRRRSGLAACLERSRFTQGWRPLERSCARAAAQFRSLRAARNALRGATAAGPPPLVAAAASGRNSPPPPSHCRRRCHPLAPPLTRFG